jgi:hypothetical protein
VKNRRRSSVWIIILLASAFLILVSSVRPVAAQSVTLTPNVGTGGTLVQISGSGFDSTTTVYTVVASPNAAGSFSMDISTTPTAICNNLGSGSCVGTFHVSATAPAGIYVVQLTGSIVCTSCGPVFAQFVVGAPSAQISLSPTVANAGTVTISGSGFSVADTGCTISTGTTSIDTALFGVAVVPPCSMSVGNAAGSFIVDTTTAPAGLYVITVTGCTSNPCTSLTAKDFASAYFEVPSTTTTTTTSLSIISFTSAVATQTNTTTATISTRTTTSISSTGITTEQSYAFTQATYLAQSTSTSTSTTLTTATATLASTQRTTTTLFTTSVLGGVITPPLYSPSSEMVNIVGMISVIGLIGPILLRRFLS